MKQESAISLSNTSKVYRIWSNPEARLKSAFWNSLGQKEKSEALFRDFRALSSLTLEIPRGQSLGIIGLNGSGKSTLLQLIAGTLQPSTGEVTVRGRLAALLELGAGFNPEFTGRENVYMNAAVLGLSRAEVDSRFPAIADFADIGDFIEQPVKTYSSGMFIRLAFAVLTQVDPEILIIDEALAVGDFLFQQKCYDRIREFRRSGCTFLFVTHGMGTVLELCDRAIVLERGQMIFDGEPKAAVDLYEAHSMRSRFGNLPPPVENKVSSSPETTPETVLIGASSDSTTAVEYPAVAPATAEKTKLITEPLVSTSPELLSPPAEPAITTETVTLQKVLILDASGQHKQFLTSGERIRIVIQVKFHHPVRDPHIGFKLRNQLGVVFYETNTYCMRKFPGSVETGEIVTAEFAISVPFVEGEYSITAGVANEGKDRGSFAQALHYQHEACHFAVIRDWNQHDWHGLFNLDPKVSISRRFDH